MKNFGILILGHGSRISLSNQEFEEWVKKFQNYNSNLEIRYAHIELAQPNLKTALVEFSKEQKKIIIVPLFLFTSGHIKNDIPIVISQLKLQFPEHEYLIAEAIGPEPRMIQLLAQNAQKSSQFVSSEHQSKTGVIIIGRGSSDIDANGDFYKLVRLFEESNSYFFVFPTFIGITRPLFSRTLDMAAKLRPDRLVILPYFLFGGKLVNQIKILVDDFSKNYPWIRIQLASHIGPDPLLFEIINEKVMRILSGGFSLPCVGCEYRTQISTVSNKVGGLKALLWSLRHLETHTQVGGHEYPHKALKKQVFVCENYDCAGRGSAAIISKMRGLLKAAGQSSQIRVTKTSCMGRCGEGPSIVVYPDGVWYQKVQISDVEDLVNGHLLNDQIVHRIVDTIMQ